MTQMGLLLKQIADERAAYEKAVLAGSPKDFADYRQLTGVIQGLTRAENIVKDLVQKLEKSDE